MTHENHSKTEVQNHNDNETALLIDARRDLDVLEESGEATIGEFIRHANSEDSDERNRLEADLVGDLAVVDGMDGEPVVAALDDASIEHPSEFASALRLAESDTFGSIDVVVAAIEKHHPTKLSHAESIDDAVMQLGGAGELTITSAHEMEVKQNDAIITEYLRKGMTYDLGEYVNELPELSKATIMDVADRLKDDIGGRRNIARMMAKFELTDAQTLGQYFRQPDETAKLLRDPELTNAMADFSIYEGRVEKSLFDVYDEERDESRRHRLEAHMRTLMNPEATERAKRFSGSLLKLASSGYLGELTPGEIGQPFDKFDISHNKLESVPVPFASRLSHVGTEELPAKTLRDMTPEELRMVLTSKYLEAHEGQDGIDVNDASLADLKGEFQELCLAEILARSERDSTDFKDLQSDRNAKMVESGDRIFKMGDLVHTSYPANLGSILRNGLVCGELIGKAHADADAFPLNVDFYKLSEEADRGAVKSISSRIEHRDVNGDMPITLVIDRSIDESDDYPDRPADPDQQSDNRHYLVMGALPSSHIRAIVLHGGAGESEVARIKQNIARHGAYIPLVNDDGEVLMSKAEFEAVVPETDFGPIAADTAFDYKNPTPPWSRTIVSSGIQL